MKIRNKRGLQQIALNHLSDIELMNLYNKCTAKQYLVTDTTLKSDNPSRF